MESSQAMNSSAGGDFSIWNRCIGDRVAQQLRLGSEVKVTGVDSIAGDCRDRVGIVVRIEDKVIEVNLEGENEASIFSNPSNLKATQEPDTPLAQSVSNVAHTIFFSGERVKVEAADRIHFHGKEGRVQGQTEDSLYLVDFGPLGKRTFMTSELLPATIGQRTLAQEALPFFNLSEDSGITQAAGDLLAQKENMPIFQGLLDGLEDCVTTREEAEALVREVGRQPNGSALLRNIVEYFHVHGNPDSISTLHSDCRSFINRTDGKEMLFTAAVKGYIQIALEEFRLTSKTGDELIAVLGNVLNCLDNANATLTVWGEPLLRDMVIREHLRELVCDSVTFEIMDKPVRIDGCNHVFNQTTALMLINNDQCCPHCRGAVDSYSRDKELELHIAEFKRLTGDNLEGLVDGFSLL